MVPLKKFPRALRLLFTKRRNYTTTASTKQNPETNDRPQEKPAAAVPPTSSVAVPNALEAAKAVTKTDLKWRTAWHQREGQYFIMLRSFSSDENNTVFQKIAQGEIKFSPSAIKAWWKRKREERLIYSQSFLEERNQTLGNELAAAHFLVYRGGAVKFVGENRWIQKDEDGLYDLPRRYDSERYLEAIDCSGTDIFYEGLVNFRDLQQVQWLSFRGCKNVDDWCIDRIACLFRNTAVYLDIRDCPQITHRGLCALYKMKELKILMVDTMYVTESFELSYLLLQHVNPSLDVRSK